MPPRSLIGPWRTQGRHYDMSALDPKPTRRRADASTADGRAKLLFVGRTQYLQQNDLEGDRDADALAPDRPFQRLGDLRFRQFAGRGLGGEIMPRRRQRLAWARQ